MDKYQAILKAGKFDYNGRIHTLHEWLTKERNDFLGLDNSPYKVICGWQRKGFNVQYSIHEVEPVGVDYGTYTISGNYVTSTT